MNKKAVTYIVLALLILGVVWYLTYSPDFKDKTYYPSPGIDKLTLKVEAPFSSASLVIAKDGSVTYAARKEGETETKDSHTITPGQLRELLSLAKSVNFFEMRNKPKGPNDPEDGSSYTIEASTGLPDSPSTPSTYSVSCYEPSCESGFLELKVKMIELWGKEILEVGV